MKRTRSIDIKQMDICLRSTSSWWRPYAFYSDDLNLWFVHLRYIYCLKGRQNNPIRVNEKESRSNYNIYTEIESYDNIK